MYVDINRFSSNLSRIVFSSSVSYECGLSVSHASLRTLPVFWISYANNRFKAIRKRSQIFTTSSSSLTVTISIALEYTRFLFNIKRICDNCQVVELTVNPNPVYQPGQRMVDREYSPITDRSQ